MPTAGPTLVIDKSALQSLTSDEGFLLGRFFHLILAPPLFLEIRADLAKSARSRRTPQREVAILAEKISGFAASVNIDHYNMSIANLLGNKVEMRGRSLIGGARKIETPDGRSGYFIDEPPEIRSLRCWSEGDFTDEDWEFARLWRESIAQSDLSEVQRSFSWMKDVGRKITTLDGILDVIDQTFGNENVQHELLEHTMEIIHIPIDLRSRIVDLWKRSGKPMIGVHAPYATHVVRLDFFFYGALGRGLIGARNQHRIDLSYLYYLPFCNIFVSSDKLHKVITPMFLSGRRMFIPGAALKADLSALQLY